MSGGVGPGPVLATVAGVSDRPQLIGVAYEALGRGDLRPWRRVLDDRVVWRAVDVPEEPETPT